jgi:catechol 2,3-dioxygenase-like lactoylglutathione lyase family enzyme
MERVTGIGGVFFKCQDADALRDWYRDHLGVDSEPDNGASFHWRDRDRPDRIGYTVWGPFDGDTAYFDPSPKPFMFNFPVHDLDAMLAQLRAAGVEVDDRVEEYDFGRFGWFMDPERNRVELWEPAGPGGD